MSIRPGQQLLHYRLIEKIDADLEARYVLQGSVRTTGQRIRLRFTHRKTTLRRETAWRL